MFVLTYVPNDLHTPRIYNVIVRTLLCKTVMEAYTLPRSLYEKLITAKTQCLL